MSSPPHDRAIPIPTNETQNDGVNNAELPRECGDSEDEREEPEPNDGSVPTTISQDNHQESDQESAVQLQQAVRVPDKKVPLSGNLSIPRANEHIHIFSNSWEEPVTGINVKKARNARGFHKIG